MYFSSGDGSGVLAPSSDPYAIAVGGTTLGIGKSGSRLFETGWSDGDLPAEQQELAVPGRVRRRRRRAQPALGASRPTRTGVVPTALATAPGNRGGTVRSVPDISADADPFTGAAVGVLTFHNKQRQATDLQPVPGRRHQRGRTPGGRPGDGGAAGPASLVRAVNPALYQLAGTSALYDALPLTSSSPVAYRGVACDPHDCGLWAASVWRVPGSTRPKPGCSGHAARPPGPATH